MLITNANVITWEEPNRILENYALYIAGGRIADVGPQLELTDRYPDEQRLDAHSQYVMPGNICAHTHFYGTFSRGLAIPGSPPTEFPEILQKLWWPLDKSLTLDDIRCSVQFCLIDAIRHGTTALIDHHASPNAIPGSLDVIAEEVEQAGLRAVLCYEVTDRDGEDKTNAGIQENIRFIDRIAMQSSPDRRLAATFGLHASLTLSDTTLDRCRTAVPDEIGFHIHVAEHEADQYDSLAKSGLRIVDRLYQHNLLGPHSIAAHAVHVDAREIALLAETATWVTHQPRSNMNNAVGVAPVESMLRAGVKVCLGNDGFSNALWEEWKTAYLIHKVWNRDPRRMPGTDVVRMGAYNNAALLHTFFPLAPIGVIKPGAYADLIFVDYPPPTPVTPDNLPWHILFGFNESMVTTTMVAGRVLMQDRQLLTIDPGEVSTRARLLVPGVWKRFQKSSPK